MLPFHLPCDRMARESLQRQRNKEAERQLRIFNDRVRTIGVDLASLDFQIKEKKEQEAAAKKRENELDANMLRDSKVASILQRRDAQEQKEVKKAVATFRHQHQQFCQRREFDLNDPDWLKKTKPCDAQMMPPGLLGEDVGAESRKQRQKEQMKEWIHQQKQEQKAARDQQWLEEQRYNQSKAEMENMADQLQSLELEERKAAVVATKYYNMAQIEEKQRLEEASSHLSGQLGETELCSSSDRRSPPQSVQQVVQYQKQQMEEMRRRKEQKKEEEEKLDGVRLGSARSALLMERQQARMNKELRRHMDTTNAQLAKIIKEQKSEMERGGIDDSFFSQFNTCSR
ncbi:RIB43A-like with coiled-coils protein 2 [Gouania willdenowi]|uniref:RIB43A-like with coiled-coils protein 2 n=1 Tax=Gouania willdenowi TaxID=441366 RepID=A0A8C5EV49_GOUWI|nr:RIB43A-like with coiled-coils protein 2 [Gouania willdenowi]